MNAKCVIPTVRSVRRRAVDAILTGGAIVACITACQNDPLYSNPGDAKGFSAAYGIRTPGPNDTCIPEIHHKYSVVGPDGLLYPTWHPPIDPATGCQFGHEHGRDPRGSDLYQQVGPIPFGYANQKLDEYDPLHLAPRRSFRPQGRVGERCEAAVRRRGRRACSR